MAESISIQEPQKRLTSAPELKSFLSLGFRPLYIAGCGWALLSILLWIYFPSFLDGPLGGVMWHAHEMLWAFVATIAVGFLLTAAATWTGFNPVQGAQLAGLVVLWAVARIGYLTGDTGFYIASVAESLFFGLSAIALAKVVLKAKSKRNYGVPWLVAGLCVANALFLKALQEGDYALLMQHFELGLICMAIIALLIARRVIPFFAMRAVSGLDIPMLTRSGHVQMAGGVLAIAFGLAGWSYLMAVALLVVGLISLYQLAKWKPQAVLRKPILWILYVGYLLMGLGLLLAAMHVAGWPNTAFLRSAVYVHVLGMGGFAVLIIGMVTRTALGHLGRPLALDASMVASYILLLVAVAFRVAALWPTPAVQGLLHAAAAAWIAAFGLYLWRFVPLLIRPRL